MRRFRIILSVVFCTVLAASSAVSAGSPTALYATDPDLVIRPVTSYFTWDQTRGGCYRGYQRARAWVNLSYNDGDIYRIKLHQYFEVKLYGHWVRTGRFAWKSLTVYGDEGYLSINPKFYYSDDDFTSTADTRIRTKLQFFHYDGRQEYAWDRSRVCG